MISAQTLLDALRKAGLDESTERQLIEDPAYAEMVVITAKLERLKNLAARLSAGKAQRKGGK